MDRIMTGILIIGLMSVADPLTAGEKLWQKGDSWPYKKPTILKSVVEVVVATRNADYQYKYKVSNFIQSERPITIFEVDLRNYPIEGGVSLRNLDSLEAIQERDNKVEKASRVHVSSKTSPERWGEGLLDNGGWGADPYRGLPPGASENKFSFTAKEPPGIRDYVLDAYDNKWDTFLQDMYRKSPETAGFYQNSKEFMTEANNPLENLNKTIAPVAPPEPFTISSWTIRMAEYAVEARKQKWIKTDKTLAEVKRLIGALKTEDKGKLEAAIGKIESYATIEKKKGNLTEEADALIRLNAQYLLQRSGKNKK